MAEAKLVGVDEATGEVRIAKVLPRRYGLKGSFEPLIPRELRLEFTERVDAEGEVLVALGEEEVRRPPARAADLCSDTPGLTVPWLASSVLGHTPPLSCGPAPRAALRGTQPRGPVPTRRQRSA